MKTESLDMKVTTKQIAEGEIFDSEYWKAGTTATDQLSVPKDIDVLMDSTKLIVPYHAVDNAVAEKVIEEVERPDDETCPDPIEPTSSYTVSFYNGETLLETVDVASGDSAEYTGETPTYQGEHPENYVFIGWEPAPTEVHSDMDCYAQFKELTYEDVEITDDWATILASIEDGTITAKYNIGNYKPLDLGTEGIINMQIVAFDTEELASGNGSAKTTWVSKELLNTQHRMNPMKTPSSAPYDEGTGGIGGWDKSEMKQYILADIVPRVPSSVANNVKAVKKYTRSIDTSGTAVENVETSETFWIPSRREVFGEITWAETQGPIYSLVYPDAASRIKHTANDNTAIKWWDRTGTADYGFGSVKVDGSNTNSNSYESKGVALGFCL